MAPILIALYSCTAEQ